MVEDQEDAQFRMKLSCQLSCEAKQGCLFRLVLCSCDSPHDTNSSMVLAKATGPVILLDR